MLSRFSLEGRAPARPFRFSTTGAERGRAGARPSKKVRAHFVSCAKTPSPIGRGRRGGEFPAARGHECGGLVGGGFARELREKLHGLAEGAGEIKVERLLIVIALSQPLAVDLARDAEQFVKLHSAAAARDGGAVDVAPGERFAPRRCAPRR